MDLEENIRIAANVAAMNELYDVTSFEKGFIAGAKSQAAKDYWYNEFKRELWNEDFQKSIFTNKPIKSSNVFCTGSGLTNKENELWQKQVVEPTYEMPNGIMNQIDWEQYQEYIDEHPDRPISFDNWKYMVEHYGKPELISKHDIPDIVNGKAPHYPYGIIQSDPLYGATKKDFDNAKPKNIGIIGGVGPGVAILGMDLMSSIEQISFDLMNSGEAHIKGVIAIVPDQKSIKESRAWDIKKQKKVSHKKNNKRK